MQRASYKMRRWLSNEGSTEGLSEVWLDRFFEPKNIVVPTNGYCGREKKNTFFDFARIS